MTVQQRAADHWASATWWRRHSEESKLTEQCLQFALNLELLAAHMLANPLRYEIRGNKSDWEIYQAA